MQWIVRVMCVVAAGAAYSAAGCSSSDGTAGEPRAQAQDSEADECCVLRKVCNAGCACSSVQVETAANGTGAACADIPHDGCAAMPRDQAVAECAMSTDSGEEVEVQSSDCVPGTTAACDCPVGMGTATCGDDRTYGTCDCEPVISQQEACLEMNEVLCGELVGCGFESDFRGCVEQMPVCDLAVPAPQSLVDECIAGLYAQSCDDFELIIMPVACEDILRL